MPPKIEDDIDDLDDVLEQFNAPPTRPAPTPPTASTSKPSSSKAGLSTQPLPEGIAETDEEAELARQFAADMEAFMRGLTESELIKDPSDPNAAQSAADAAENLRKAWEKLLIEDLEGGPEDGTATTSIPSGSGSSKATASSAPSSQPATSTSTEDDFQRAVRQAAEKLRESNKSHKAEEAAPAGDFASLLEGLGDLGLGGDDQGVQGMLETLMAQLMSKEILHEPLKELSEKFPGYLKEHDATLSQEDRTKYERQLAIVTEVVGIFEQPNYSDEDAESTSKIVGLMTEMQSLGSPPSEIMGSLPPGMELGADGLPNLGQENCVIA